KERCKFKWGNHTRYIKDIKHNITLDNSEKNRNFKTESKNNITSLREEKSKQSIVNKNIPNVLIRITNQYNKTLHDVSSIEHELKEKRRAVKQYPEKFKVQTECFSNPPTLTDLSKNQQITDEYTKLVEQINNLEQEVLIQKSKLKSLKQENRFVEQVLERG